MTAVSSRFCAVGPPTWSVVPAGPRPPPSRSACTSATVASPLGRLLRRDEDQRLRPVLGEDRPSGTGATSSMASSRSRYALSAASSTGPPKSATSSSDPERARARRAAGTRARSRRGSRSPSGTSRPPRCSPHHASAGDRDREHDRGGRERDAQRPPHQQRRPALPEPRRRAAWPRACAAACRRSSAGSETRCPSAAISAGSSVTAASTAIADDHDRADGHRAHHGRVDQEQPGERDDHGHAAEGDRHAGGAQRDRARLVRVQPVGELLAVAGEDEQGVVHRHADAEHRRHVGHEGRHAVDLREEEDDRAGDDHRGHAERERQRGRRQRAEDDQQDDQHDRQAEQLRPARGPPWTAPGCRPTARSARPGGSGGRRRPRPRAGSRASPSRRPRPRRGRPRRRAT